LRLAVAVSLATIPSQFGSYVKRSKNRNLKPSLAKSLAKSKRSSPLHSPQLAGRWMSN